MQVFSKFNDNLHRKVYIHVLIKNIPCDILRLFHIKFYFIFLLFSAKYAIIVSGPKRANSWTSRLVAPDLMYEGYYKNAINIISSTLSNPLGGQKIVRLDVRVGRVQVKMFPMK